MIETCPCGWLLPRDLDVEVITRGVPPDGTRVAVVIACPHCGSRYSETDVTGSEQAPAWAARATKGAPS